MNQGINIREETNTKPYNLKEQHTDYGIFNNNNNNEGIFNPERFCWKCHSLLRLRKTRGHNYGLYCTKCCRFRKLRVEVRGGGFCRTDVRRSGALKRRVLLGER